MNEEFIDNIITNLKIIGMIQINDKLSVRKGHLQLDKESGVQFVKRWFFRDSRSMTINYIKEIVRNMNILFSRIKLNNSNNNNLINIHNTNNNTNIMSYTNEDIIWIMSRILGEMEKVEVGLNNLKTTYSFDPVTIVMLENIINKLKELSNIGKGIIQ